MSCENCVRLASEVAALRARLEVSDSHDFDGIESRDQTIKLLENEIQRLKGNQGVARTTLFRGNAYRQKLCLKDGYCVGCAFSDDKGRNKGCPTFDPKIDVQSRLSVWRHDKDGKAFIWELVSP